MSTTETEHCPDGIGIVQILVETGDELLVEQQLKLQLESQPEHLSEAELSQSRATGLTENVDCSQDNERERDEISFVQQETDLGDHYLKEGKEEEQEKQEEKQEQENEEKEEEKENEGEEEKGEEPNIASDPVSKEKEEKINNSESAYLRTPESESQKKPIMDEIAPSELESLNFSETEVPPTDHGDRLIQNNENETIEEKKQFSPIPSSHNVVNQNQTPMKSGIRPPTTVLRQPKVSTVTTPARPSTTTSSAPRAISTPRQTASTAPSPRPLTKMSRERSDVQKSVSTRSIDNVGKFTPKMNAKFVNVKSKIGSVTNHKAGGGNVEIFSEKRMYTAQPKVGSMKNASHVAGGGNVQIESRKLDFSNASSKVGSKTNYQPVKSDVKIVSEKLTWQAKSKVGSLDNAAHKPTGGNVQILNHKLNWKAESKVGSKDNMNHRPGGGNVKIFDEKIRFVSTDSSRNHSALDISSL